MAVVPVRGSEVFKVIYKGENTGKVRINIYNKQAEVVFSETLSGVSGFIRPLNFSGLESGEYTVELVDASGKKVEKIVYKPVVDSKHIHISKLSKDGGKFLVAVANAGTANINVRIYDAAHNLVHSEVKNVNDEFAQIYTVKNVSGAVTFEVSDNAGNTKTIRF